MNKDFIRNRITQLRLAKELSERKLSFELGHSDGYINNIINNDKMPSYDELFYMCEYFGITASVFFDEEIENPILVQKAINLVKELDEEDLKAVIAVMEQLKKRKDNKSPCG